MLLLTLAARNSLGVVLSSPVSPLGLQDSHGTEVLCSEGFSAAMLAVFTVFFSNRLQIVVEAGALPLGSPVLFLMSRADPLPLPFLFFALKHQHLPPFPAENWSFHGLGTFVPVLVKKIKQHKGWVRALEQLLVSLSSVCGMVPCLEECVGLARVGAVGEELQPGIILSSGDSCDSQLWWGVGPLFLLCDFMGWVWR